MRDRGGPVDHATINRWVITDSPQLEEAFPPRQVKYLNTLVAQDQRAVKRVTRPLLGCKTFAAAQAPRGGIALRPMLQKRQLVAEAGAEHRMVADLCSSLAAESRHRQRPRLLHDLLSKIGDTTFCGAQGSCTIRYVRHWGS